MKLPALFRELQELAGKLGLEVTQDRGSFKGGLCRFEGEDMIVLNKSATLNQRARQLAEILAAKNLNDIYIKPGVRAALEKYQSTIDS
ncbi:MAG: hypothetical protein IIA59_13505 [Candidatus Marinimicrobia bacterium]|nr:hypothetical protein [Candidatus Neomarinimicrobiota bacterium]